MTNWMKCIDILRRAGANDHKLILFEIVKLNPAVVVKAVASVRARAKK